MQKVILFLGECGVGLMSEVSVRISTATRSATNQEHGKEWEYRIMEINKSGEGEPSNTVMAVL